ncbi:MAG TPA: alkaline phosphatase family protein [Nevskia sp.]|nr:alkaline phosphatase family protein [Nevskia sp.]
MSFLGNRFGLVLAGLLSAALAASCGSSTTAPSGPASSRIGHVFVLILENEDYQNSFGPSPAAPYLATTLPAKGVLLQNYYGTGHNSLDNYISMISGQSPNLITQLDCQTYSEFVGTITAADGQLVGQGCIYPASVGNIADQLEKAGLSWKGYMEDMGNTPTREAATCGHPAIGTQDGTQSATAADQYATRHDPFMYFHSIIDDQARCDSHVVNLDKLPADLASTGSTPNYVFITPSLCHDGHDSPCANGEPGGLVSINSFLQQWVPQILASPAFQQDGLLIVTYDESSGLQSDSSACCGEGPGPNTLLPGLTGLGGGRVGAVLISPFIKPGTVSTTPYNHYSMLRSVQDIFGLPYLGLAGASGQAGFGSDVYTSAMPEFPPKQ